MKTEHRFCVALKSLMEEKPLDEITVLSLTKRCKLKRQSFYYHFHDIYDLLSLVFLNEEIDRIQDSTNLNMMVGAIYKYYEDNLKFIQATLNSAGKDLFMEFLYNNCYQTILRIINTKPIAPKLTMTNKKNVARFYGSAYANSLVYYFSTVVNKSLSGIQYNFAFMNDDVLDKAIESLTKSKPISKKETV